MKKNILFGLIFSLALLALPVFASVEDDATALYNKGIDFYEQNKFEQSIATFQKAIAIKPDFYEAYYNLARVQESANKLKEASESYEEVLKLKPDDYDSMYEYGNILYRRGYLKKAVETLDKIPQDSDLRQKADPLTAKIKVRQIEIAEETRIKTEQAKRASIIGNIPAPSGLVVDSKSNIYVASFSQNVIFKFSSNGQNKTIFIDKTKGISGPVGLTIDSYDNLYVANYLKNDIMIIDKNGNATVLMYAKKPYCLSLDEVGKKLYVTEQQNNSVISYDLTEVLKKSDEKKSREAALAKKEKERTQKEEVKIITAPSPNETPIGTPSIIESNMTRNASPQTSIAAPIMVPSDSVGF